MKKIKTDEIVKFDENWDLENLKQTYNRMQKFGFVCEECGKEFFRILLNIRPNEKRLCHSCGNPNRKFKNIVTKETVFVDVTKEDPTKLYSKVQQISFNCLDCGRLTQRPNYSRDFLCKYCLSKKTKVEKYGSLENAGEIKKQHMKETFKEKYGVESFSQTNEFKQKLKEKANKRTPEERAAIKEKTIKTNREKYGKDYFCQTDEWLKVRGLDKEKIEKNKEFLKLSKEEKLEKLKEKNKEKYGTDYYTQTEEFKKKAKLTKLQNGTWAKVTHKKYFFENLYFDSCQEVALYDFYKKQNKKIERNTTEYFEYIFKNEIHRYYPDFKLDNEYLEVKGDHLFELMQKEGTKDAAKYKCMQEHHVKILKSSEVNLLIGNMDFYKKFQISILNLPKPLEEKFNHLKYSCENFPFLNYSDEVLKREWLVLCETKKEKPQAGKKIVKQFHKSIFECNKVGFLSPLKKFEKLENYEYSLKKVILKNLEKNEDEIKDEFLKNFRNFKVNTFQPGFAKYLIQKYLKDADVIFDPFSSFSSRMLAAVSCNKNYIGRDCSQKRIEESKQMSSFLQIESKVNLEVKNIYETESIEKYPYMFTCIPYESERYEGTEEDWIKSSDECIDFILQHFDCQKYVIVVDKTEKYKDHLIKEVNNTSHFGKGFENILIFEKECN